MVYMPLLEETGHMPTEKYAHGPEILEHCQRIGKRFGLNDGALFHTEVTGLEWDDVRARWVVSTDRGDEFTASFLSRSEEHTSELQSLMRISYAVFCLKKKNKDQRRKKQKRYK